MSTPVYFSTRMQRLVAQGRYLPRVFSLVWTASRRWTTAWLVLAVMEGILPVATVYLTRAVVNALVGAVRSSGATEDMRRFLALGGLIALVMLASRLLRSLKSWAGETQAELVREHITSLIHSKSAEAALQFYDSPDFYDHLHRAREEARYRPVLLLENLGALLQNGITLLAMVAILIPYGPLLPIALVVSTLPAFYLVIRSSERRHKLGRETTAAERKAGYFDWLITSAEVAQELRLFGLADHFQETYRSIRQKLRERRMRLARQQSLSEIWTSLLSLAAIAAAVFYMVRKSLAGVLSLGDLALFYQAFNQGLSLSQALLANVGQLYENILFLGNLFEFLDFESNVKDAAVVKKLPEHAAHQVAFQDVSFRYPGTDRFVLKNLNLTVPAGKIVAVVGPNGSGKSTLIKLLCRFYDPHSGTVSLDGTPLPELSLAELRSHISALFQAPVHYNATFRQNLEYGELSSAAQNRTAAAAVAAGADSIAKGLPEGYQTILGRWFTDGVELSLGEWQRVALARALYRNAPILILDEPTSAMDPWAEMEWARRLRDVAAGRTTIVITHRFTTAMYADRIFVLQEGELKEEGSHDELITRGGLYASGWAQQETSRS